MDIPISVLVNLPRDPSQSIQDLSDDHHKRLRRFIHKRVLNPEDADDILQLTYLEAWRNRHHFSARRSLLEAGTRASCMAHALPRPFEAAQMIAVLPAMPRSAAPYWT